MEDNKPSEIAKKIIAHTQAIDELFTKARTEIENLMEDLKNFKGEK